MNNVLHILVKCNENKKRMKTTKGLKLMSNIENWLKSCLVLYMAKFIVSGRIQLIFLSQILSATHPSSTDV